MGEFFGFWQGYADMVGAWIIGNEWVEVVDVIGDEKGGNRVFPNRGFAGPIAEEERDGIEIVVCGSRHGRNHEVSGTDKDRDGDGASTGSFEIGAIAKVVGECLSRFPRFLG